MIGCLRTRVRKQPIISLYFEFDTVLKFYNLEAWHPFCGTCNSYNMGFPSVLGDNLRALAIRLFYVQVYKYGIPILYNLYQVEKHVIPIYTTYISEDFDHHEIFRAKVGHSGIKANPTNPYQTLQNALFKQHVNLLI